MSDRDHERIHQSVRPYTHPNYQNYHNHHHHTALGDEEMEEHNMKEDCEGELNGMSDGDADSEAKSELDEAQGEEVQEEGPGTDAIREPQEQGE